MITPNVSVKLPSSVLMYRLISSVIAGVVLVLIAGLFFSIGTLHGTSTVAGVTSPTSFSLVIPAIVLLILALIAPLHAILWFMTFSYSLNEQTITINSGVIFRQSKTIAFNKIQNVNALRGPLQMLFGLTQLDLWTASQDQMGPVSFSFGNNQSRNQAAPKPEGQLFLSSVDATELKNYIEQRATVQNVRVV